MVTRVVRVYDESGGRTAPVLADRYRLTALLGRGGTARVLQAWDEHLSRAVAIKIFQPHADPVGRLRFEDEARLLAAFDHPALVTVFDSGYANGEPFLVLELINGPHLGRRIDQKPLTPDESRALGAALADALAYVHSQGVVHRDVKPGNVLLDERGRPYLADFGLAKLLARSGITASDRLVGTAAYLSPEQVLGTEVEPAADIYSLGLVLLECLTGEIEYPGLDAETVLARLGRPPRIPDDLPASLAGTLEAMSRSDPGERPDAATCGELLRERKHLTPPTPPWTRRLTRTKVAVTLGAGVAAGALVLATPLTETGTTPPPVQPNQGEVGNSTIESGTPVVVVIQQPTSRREADSATSQLPAGGQPDGAQPAQEAPNSATKPTPDMPGQPRDNPGLPGNGKKNDKPTKPASPTTDRPRQ